MSSYDGETRLVLAESPNRMMLALLATFVVVFVLQLAVPPFGRFAIEYLAMDTATFIRRLFLWQAVTSIFLHGGVQHLLGNLMFFWLFGTGLSNAWRKGEFLAFFLACGIGGSLCFYGVNVWRTPPGGPGIVGLGASGAVFGLMMAYAMVFGERIVLAFFIIPMRVKYFVAICFGLEVLLVCAGVADGIAHIAHVGGAVVGGVYLKLVWWYQARQAGQAVGRPALKSRIDGLEIMDKNGE